MKPELAPGLLIKRQTLISGYLSDYRIIHHLSGKIAYWKDFKRLREAKEYVQHHLPLIYLSGSPVNWEDDEFSILTSYREAPTALHSDRNN